jgi:hypothetical protein
MARDEETAEEFPGENLVLLYSLYERAGIPQSLAWQAAAGEEWIVSPEAAAAPDAPVAAAGPYQLPAVPVLSQLTGIPGLTEENRDELEPAASRLASVVDRLAGLGITTRAGDAIALTPLGSAPLRDALILGTAELDEKAAASFQTWDEVLSWDARQLAGAGNWRRLPADGVDVPASARAVLIAGKLQEVSRAALLAHRMTAADVRRSGHHGSIRVRLL